MLWVPPGFAHGFVVLSESADFLYRVTDFWAPEHERAIAWDDPDLNVKWPLPEGVQYRTELSGVDPGASAIVAAGRAAIAVIPRAQHR